MKILLTFLIPMIGMSVCVCIESYVQVNLTKERLLAKASSRLYMLYLHFVCNECERDPLLIVFVKEQRVYDNYNKSVFYLSPSVKKDARPFGGGSDLLLRCTLKDFEKNYQLKILSNSMTNVRFYSTDNSNLSLTTGNINSTEKNTKA